MSSIEQVCPQGDVVSASLYSVLVVAGPSIFELDTGTPKLLLSDSAVWRA